MEASKVADGLNLKFQELEQEWKETRETPRRISGLQQERSSSAVSKEAPVILTRKTSNQRISPIPVAGRIRASPSRSARAVSKTPPRRAASPAKVLSDSIPAGASDKSERVQSPPRSDEKPKFCKNCGFDLRSCKISPKFCRECGSKVEV
eukprot:GILI01019138.1.p1 GENE.GILI01019138.1~~GILI01019138.1.p1  ORF type:complete len:167 (+),score=2.54 GILI01019138.1:52-501(+)